MSSYVLYRAFDANEKLLYVGQSTSVIGRLKEHIKSSEWSGFVDNITLQRFTNERQLFRAEMKAIQEEKPMYNKTHNRRYREQIVELRLKITQLKDELRREKNRRAFKEAGCIIYENAIKFIEGLPLSDELRKGYDLWKVTGDWAWVYKDEVEEQKKNMRGLLSVYDVSEEGEQLLEKRVHA